MGAEVTVVDFIDIACGASVEVLSCDDFRECTQIPCEGNETDGWLRPRMDTMPEGISRIRTLEARLPSMPNSFIVGDFPVDIPPGTCEPEFITEVFCGYEPGCEAEYVITVWDALGDFTVPLAQQSGFETYNEGFTSIVMPLGQFQDTPMIIALAAEAQDNAASNMIVFDMPRVVGRN